MQYVHIKNIKKYQPGYTDRKHIWAKVYWDIFIDEKYQDLCEIDRHRFIGLIVYEVYTQKEVPLKHLSLTVMGWDIKKRSIALTLQMLQPFIEVSTENVPKSRVEKSREEKNRVEKSKEEDSNAVSTLIIKEPILYLNKKSDRNFDPNNQSHLDLIKARMSEGRTIEQFKSIIDKKIVQWKNDAKMMNYLRPSTLFNRTNFENYLNEKTVTPNREEKKINPSCDICNGTGILEHNGQKGQCWKCQ